MPAFGILYWAKYRFADLSMISELYGTATRVDLNKFSICNSDQMMLIVVVISVLLR